jgi:DNA-binding GntR family transcriptional regulator
MPSASSSVTAGAAFAAQGLSAAISVRDESPRIGHIFYRPTDERMEVNLQRSCHHHDQMIAAIADRDEAAMARLVDEHWELARSSMEMFVVPREMKSDAVGRISKEASAKKQVA